MKALAATRDVALIIVSLVVSITLLLGYAAAVKFAQGVSESVNAPGQLAPTYPGEELPDPTVPPGN